MTALLAPKQARCCGLLAGVACLGLALSPAARADARLDVSGHVLSTDNPGLRVQIVLANRGDLATTAIEVSGEWQQQRRSARLPGGLAPGAHGEVVLEFAPTPAVQAGVHALPLLLEHALDGPQDAGGNPPLASERAWLLLAFGESLPPAVELHPRALELSVRGELTVELSSRDGRAHPIELRALTARGLRVENEAAVPVAVAGSGVTLARVPLVRAGAGRGTHQGVLLLAESREPGPLRTSVAVAEVRVAEQAALLPRLRTPLVVLAGLLLATALGIEAWRVLRRPPIDSPPSA